MAERKFLFMAADGFSEEATSADHVILSGLVIGSGTYSAGKITGLTGGSATGEALVYGQSGASLVGLNLTNDLVMNSHKITNLANGTNPTDAVTYSQLQSVAAGISWLDPVAVINLISDADQGGSPPSSPSAGDAYIVNNWGITYTNGDLIEWDGSAWNVVVAGSSEIPADGLRVVVTSSGAGGTFAGKENSLMQYDTSGGWVVFNVQDGDAVLVNGENGYYENYGYTYDSSGPSWVQFAGPNVVGDGDGLSKSGNVMNVNFGDGITNVSDYVTVDLDSNPGLQLSGTTPDKKLSVLPNNAAGIDVTASGVEVELEADGAIVFDAVNGGLEVNLEASNPTLDIVSNELGVKYSSTASGLDQDANGLKVKVDGTTIQINGSGQLNAIGSDEASRVENDFTASEALSAGDPVYLDSVADQVAKGDASTNAKAYIVGIARTAISSGNSGPIVTAGPCAGVLSGATPGQKYFLASGGGLSTTPPNGNVRVILVGWAINSTDLFVNTIDYGKKAA